MAIYVKSITPNSLCDQCGEIQVDDLLVEINDISLIGEDISKVNEAIKTSSNNIKFVVARKSEDDVTEDVSENTNIR
ncbi:hypothetical protein HZS_628 [Henneguya salminicola]|nr:hypothetical protein HZS_628 [Henneguya salminicola]